MSEQRFELVYSPIVSIFKTLWRTLDLQFDIRGESNIPRTGPAIMAINHVSYLDFALAGTAALPAKRFVRFMAKREIFDHPVTGPLMRGMRHISVDRKNGAPSFVEALKYLQRGEIVGIFPEATISRSFELKDMKSGVTRLAIDSSAPVLPTVIWGSQRIWTKQLARDFSRSRYPISIYVGAPLYFQSDPEGSLILLKEAMQGLLDKAINDYPDSPIGQRWAPARIGGTAPTPAMIEAERRKEI